MIDLEADIFNAIAKKLRSEYPGIFVSGEVRDIPARFPAVTIVERDNAVVQKMRTTNIENAVTVMYQMDTYSNKTSGAKQEAERIAATADEEFARIGFTRLSYTPVFNLEDATIYRIVSRYQAVIGMDYFIYQQA